MFTQQPLARAPVWVEYRVLQIYSRDAGGRRRRSPPSSPTTARKRRKAEAQPRFCSSSVRRGRAAEGERRGRQTGDGCVHFSRFARPFLSGHERRCATTSASIRRSRADGGAPCSQQVHRHLCPRSEYLMLSKDITVSASAAAQDETFELKRWIHRQRRYSITHSRCGLCPTKAPPGVTPGHDATCWAKISTWAAA